MGRAASLDLFADLLDDIGIGERGDVAGVHVIGDGGQHAAHDFARARLGHVGDDVDRLWAARFCRSWSRWWTMTLSVTGLAWHDAGLQRNVNLRARGP